MTNWLPTGYHYGLHIEHDQTGRGIPFTGGGWKVVWHTTEGENLRVMQKVLKDKSAEPNLLIGKDPGEKAYTVVQFISLGKASRALMHPPGTPETNTANCIQVEICGFAKDSHEWPEALYEALANLTRLIEHRVPVPRRNPRSFANIPADRYTGPGFIRASGHVGHCHVPNNDHWDPGKFRCKHMLSIVSKKEGS